MKFVFLEQPDRIYAALVEPWVLKWPLMLRSVIKQIKRPDELFVRTGYPSFQKFIKGGIISCTILERNYAGCYESYELIKWASKRRGMGKILLMKVMNQGISIIADRNSISPQAMGSIKQIRDKYSSIFDIDPLDNEEDPLTPDGYDDCQTYNDDGGYEYLDYSYDTDTGGYYISKLDDKATGEYTDKELLDFAVELKDGLAKKTPPDIDYKKIKTEVKNSFAEQFGDVYDILVSVENDFEEAIDDIFQDVYSETQSGTIRLRREVNMRVTKSHLREIIREELIHRRHNQILLKEGLMDMLGKLASGPIQAIKESIARKVLDFLGVNVESFAGKALINFFGNIEINDLSEIISGENRCVTATRELAGAMTETMIENIPESLGMNPKGLLGKSIQEAMSAAATEKLNEAIAEALCNIDYKPILEKIPGIGPVLKMMR